MATARARSIRLSLIAIAAAAASLAGPTLTSSAAPRLSLGQVQARIAALNDQAERATEAYDAARDDLARLQRQQQVATDQLQRDQAALAAMRQRIGATADFAYRTGGFSGLNGVTALVDSSDPQSFLDSTTLLNELSHQQSLQLADVTAAAHQVATAQATVAARAAAAKRTLAGIVAAKSRIDGLLAQQRSLLASLQAADRARLARAQSADAASARAMRGSYNGPASGRAGAAVRFAYAQLGKPYVYGASGPNSYDCSGLTMAAWGAAGVSLSHNTVAQQSETRAVSRGALQPGDLVFFGSPAYHVAIYIGGGRVIAAPHTGDVVKIQSLSAMPNYSGAGRP